MNTKIRKQAPNVFEPAIIKEGIGTLRLSSESPANEQNNIFKYLNYANGYYAYLRLGKTSGAIRYYPDSQTAYTETLKEYTSLLEQGVSGSRSSFCISDSTDTIVYEGVPKPDGKIKFSIYEGEHIIKTVSLPDYNKKTIITKNNLPMKETKEPTKVSNIVYNYEQDTHADNIKQHAGIFVSRNILTQENVNFLCLSRKSVRQLAKAVQETAIINKEADDNKFENAIRDVSSNMVTITKKLASGKPTDENHCSMHDDQLYCASHSNKDYLFHDSNLWKRTPGKLNYERLEEAILDMYNRGQEMILNVPSEYQEKTASIETPTIPERLSEQNTTTTDTPTINRVATSMPSHSSFEEMIQAITSTTMTYIDTSEDTRFYLKLKGTTLESEIRSLTNNVMTINAAGDHISFQLNSGQPKELALSDDIDRSTLRNSVRTITTQLIIYAALSDKTRDSIAQAIDIDSIGDYVTSTLNTLA